MTPKRFHKWDTFQAIKQIISIHNNFMTYYCQQFHFLCKFWWSSINSITSGVYIFFLYAPLNTIIREVIFFFSFKPVFYGTSFNAALPVPKTSHRKREISHWKRLCNSTEGFFYSSPHCCTVESPCRHNCLDHYPAANTVWETGWCTHPTKTTE